MQYIKLDLNSWIHYAILTVLIVISLYFMEINITKNYTLIIILFLVLGISDQLLHNVGGFK